MLSKFLFLQWDYITSIVRKKLKCKNWEKAPSAPDRMTENGRHRTLALLGVCLLEMCGQDQPTGMNRICQQLTRCEHLEREMATRSSILAWKIPWPEEPGRLQSIGLQSQTQLSDFTRCEWGSSGQFNKHLPSAHCAPGTMLGTCYKGGNIDSPSPVESGVASTWYDAFSITGISVVLWEHKGDLRVRVREDLGRDDT